MKTSQYNFDIKYSWGKLNVEADTFLRYPVIESNTYNEHNKIVNLITKDELIEAQNEFFLILIKFLNNLNYKMV